MTLPWTKFQDFYLRLGFLKVAVAILNPERRSMLNDAIIRRLEKPLFDPASDHPAMWARVSDAFPPRKAEASDRWKKDDGAPTVAEALLVDGDCASLLFAITRPTAYKILDWAHDVHFVGRGNQIMERGLFLRRLMDERAIADFTAGDVEAWNPFHLSTTERNFFLYHLIEIDAVILGLIDRIGTLPAGEVLESRDAAQLTCRTLIDVLAGAKDTVQPKDILAYRTASDLAATIADELGVDASALSVRSIRRPPKPHKARRVIGADGVLREPRRANKNADHQTIPRFEQLVDLGFLVKPEDKKGELAQKRKWRYVPTEACRRWSELRREAIDRPAPFLWHSFARICLSTFGARRFDETPDAELIARYLWRAYERVKRPVGPNPLDTVALFAMLDALDDGYAIEVADFHRLLVTIKQRAVLTEHVFFSSGNAIDQMFIQLRPGFHEEVQRRATMLSSSEAS
jgi:hypothetical protein